MGNLLLFPKRTVQKTRLKSATTRQSRIVWLKSVEKEYEPEFGGGTYLVAPLVRRIFLVVGIAIISWTLLGFLSWFLFGIIF